MTVFYNDVSSYDKGFIGGGPVVVIKATEGSTWTDPYFKANLAAALALKYTVSGYHFLRDDSPPEAQAKHYFDVAGTLPCMLDVETEGSSKPGVDFCARFIKALTALGGRVWGVYYPRWYWAATGGNLASLEVALIASEYRTYDENNWPKAYGGATPSVWQYTSSPHDMNAFKGSADELITLITGVEMTPADVWGYKNPALDAEDMRKYLVDVHGAVGLIQTALAALSAKVDSMSIATVDPAKIADAELAEIKAKL